MVTTYIVGGAPRTGKSIIRKTILEEYNIPGISTDVLRDALMLSMPELGINEFYQGEIVRADLLWPYFKGLLETRRNYKDKFLLEGTNFLPKHLSELKSLNYIKSVFIGFNNLSNEELFKNIRENISGDYDWTVKLSDERLSYYVKEIMNLSSWFEKECNKYQIKYIDISNDFDKSLKEAIMYLMST